MEVLLFALFFIVSLIFFIAGKDDFGRKEKNLIIEDKEKEVQHLKAALQYQTKNQKKSTAIWLVGLTASCIIWCWLKSDL